MPLMRLLPRFLLLLCLVGIVSSVRGQTLPLISLPGSQENQGTKADRQQLSQSLDEIIGTLESSKQRTALLEQLKALRTSVNQAGGEAGATGNPGRGMLGALASSFNELGRATEKEANPLAIWSRRGDVALQDARQLLTSISSRQLLTILGTVALGLLIWSGMLAALTVLGRLLFRLRGWPLALPPDPDAGQLTAHFLRRVLPALLPFLIALATFHGLQEASVARMVVVVVAYAVLCGRALATVVEVVVSLFDHGHRRVAVEIIRRTALRPLFLIGMLVAFGDAVASQRLTAVLGVPLSQWLSIWASVIADLISIWLVWRTRRPVTHMLRNRPYPEHCSPSTARGLVRRLARLWHIPALLATATPLAVILFSGGEAGGVFARATVCAALLVVTLVVTGLLRRWGNKFASRRQRSEYRMRLLHIGRTVVLCVVWLVFAELTARVWGHSLLAISEQGTIGAILGQAILKFGLTVLLAWFLWVSADAGIARALRGSRHGDPRATNRAQTITPMIRNVVFFTILTIAAIVALSNFGVNVTPLLAGAGVIGLAIGFGAQTLVQDLITGVFILVEDSLAVGDFVQIGNHMGTVEGLNLRTVRLRDLDAILHIITFSHIDQIHNMSRHFGIALMKIRIPYDLPIDDAIALMKATAEDLRKDPVVSYMVWSPLEMQGIHSFEDGCPILRMRMRTAPEYQWNVAREFNLLLKRRMEKEYIHLGAPRLSVSMEAQGGRHYDRKGKEQDVDSPDRGVHSRTPSPEGS